MTISIIVILFFVGFALLLVELLLTPGIIVGAFGVLCLIAGVYMTFINYGNTAGSLVLGGAVLGSIAVVVGALKSGMWQRMASHEILEGRTREIPVDRLSEGDKGTTLSALRPSGNAFIAGLRIEVTTQGEIITAHEEIEIIKIAQGKVIVKKTETENQITEA